MKNIISDETISILNSLEDGFLRADTNGKIILANPAITQMCGYASAEEMIGLPMRTLYANQHDREQMIEALRENGKLINFELELKRKDGSTFWSLNIIKFFYDDKGNPLGTEGVIRDYTEIRQTKISLENANKELAAHEQQLRASNQQLAATEQQLRASIQQLAANEQQLKAANQQLQAGEQQLRAANQELIKRKETTEHYLNVAAEIILSLDKNGNITLLNKSGHQLLGYKNGELIGKNWFDHCLPKTNIKEIKNVFKQTINGQLENVATYESDIQTKIGHIRNILWHNTVIKDENGKISTVLCSGEDITERKKTEEALRVSEKNLKNTFNLSPSIIAKVNLAKGFFIEVNQAVTKILGYSVEEFTSKPFIELIHPDDRGTSINEKNEQLEGKEVTFFENRYLCKDGSYKWMAWYGTKADENGIVTAIGSDITDKKRSSIELNAIFNTAADGMRLIGLDYKIKKANDTFCKLVGLSKDEIMDQKCYAIFSSDLCDTDDCPLRKLQKNSCDKLETEIIETRPDGKKITTLKTATALKDDSGNFIGIVEDFKDMTEYKRAEAKLKESEAKFRSYIENAPDGVFVANEKGEYVEINPNACKMTGYREDELLKLSIPDLLQPDYLEVGLNNFQQVSRKGFAQIELGYITKSGEHRFWQVSAVKLSDTRFLGFTKDITDRKITEMALKQSEEKFRTLFNSMQEGVYLHRLVYDNEGNAINYRIIEANDISEKYLNIKSKDAIGKLATELYGTEEAPFIEVYSKVAETGEPYSFEQYFQPMDKHFFISVFSPKKGDFATVFLDITAQKQSEEELIKAKERAEESDRLKSAFLANMSHEIRTPMNGILGFTDLLKQTDLSGEEKGRYIEIIKKSGYRMLDTVNDIIDISKIDAGLVEVLKELVDICDHIESLFEFFKEEAKLKGVEMKLLNQLPDQSVMLTDKNKLNSIVSNLIKNAIKYTDKGQIEIRCNKKADNFEFSITDTGIGIPKDRIQSIFNRFEQADISDFHAKQGSGLGLSITRAYVQMLGGQILVESEVGKGSTFNFTLPWIEQQ